jgi:putative addiction module CopG family antidote
MNVVLPRALEEYVASLVETGDYGASHEVVAEALREHQARRQGLDVVMTPELERLLDEGLQDLGKARTTDDLRPVPDYPASFSNPSSINVVF